MLEDEGWKIETAFGGLENRHYIDDQPGRKSLELPGSDHPVSLRPQTEPDVNKGRNVGPANRHAVDGKVLG